MKLAVVGCTGMVGTKMLEVLAEHQFEIDELIPTASERSVGKLIEYRGKTFPVVSLETALERKPDIAIFSAGGSVSLEWAPKFAQVGTRVVDNSSAWRMNPDNKLIVPEINGDSLTQEDYIIANPNCSTIQLLMVLSPLHKAFNISKVVVSTYQSITGSGVKAVSQLEDEEKGVENPRRVYPHPIYKNALPQCDEFTENGYTKEEMKLHNETKKILNDDSVEVSATAVRVPVLGGHSESVYIEFNQEVTPQMVRDSLKEIPGLVLQDNPQQSEYPTPLQAHDKDEVFVGIIRQDLSNAKGVHLWIVADNIRKGAATNAVQIAKKIEHFTK